MNKSIILIVIMALIMLFSFKIILFAQADNIVLEQFKTSFPQVKVDEFNKTDIDGFYEIISGGRVLYYFPLKNYLFSGVVWNSAGKNITFDRESEIMTKKIKGVSKDKGVQIGKGDITILEFTNPDCYYCRQASGFFARHPNLARYVFFVSTNKNVEQKIKYVMCAKDKEKAYEEAMTGKLDGMKFEICKDEKVNNLFNEHKQIITHLGINSTPQFWINGKHVSGANIPLIESLLNQEKTDGKGK